jgi:hypothetical protein
LGLVDLIKIGDFDLVSAVCCPDLKDVQGKRIFFEEIFMVHKLISYVLLQEQG